MKSSDIHSLHILLALFVGLVAAGVVGSLAKPFAPHIVIGGIVVFSWLYWRRRATRTDFALRLATASFILGLLAIIFIRPLQVVAHAA